MAELAEGAVTGQQGGPAPTRGGAPVAKGEGPSLTADKISPLTATKIPGSTGVDRDDRPATFGMDGGAAPSEIPPQTPTVDLKGRNPSDLVGTDLNDISSAELATKTTEVEEPAVTTTPDTTTSATNESANDDTTPSAESQNIVDEAKRKDTENLLREAALQAAQDRQAERSKGGPTLAELKKGERWGEFLKTMPGKIADSVLRNTRFGQMERDALIKLVAADADQAFSPALQRSTAEEATAILQKQRQEMRNKGGISRLRAALSNTFEQMGLRRSEQNSMQAALLSEANRIVSQTESEWTDADKVFVAEHKDFVDTFRDFKLGRLQAKLAASETVSKDLSKDLLKASQGDAAEKALLNLDGPFGETLRKDLVSPELEDELTHPTDPNDAEAMGRRRERRMVRLKAAIDSPAGQTYLSDHPDAEQILKGTDFGDRLDAGITEVAGSIESLDPYNRAIAEVDLYKDLMLLDMDAAGPQIDLAPTVASDNFRALEKWRRTQEATPDAEDSPSYQDSLKAAQERARARRKRGVAAHIVAGAADVSNTTRRVVMRGVLFIPVIGGAIVGGKLAGERAREIVRETHTVEQVQQARYGENERIDARKFAPTKDITSEFIDPLKTLTAEISGDGPIALETLTATITRLGEIKARLTGEQTTGKFLLRSDEGNRNLAKNELQKETARALMALQARSADITPLLEEIANTQGLEDASLTSLITAASALESDIITKGIAMADSFSGDREKQIIKKARKVGAGVGLIFGGGMAFGEMLAIDALAGGGGGAGAIDTMATAQTPDLKLASQSTPLVEQTQASGVSQAVMEGNRGGAPMQSLEANAPALKLDIDPSTPLQEFQVPGGPKIDYPGELHMDQSGKVILDSNNQPIPRQQEIQLASLLPDNQKGTYVMRFDSTAANGTGAWDAVDSNTNMTAYENIHLEKDGLHAIKAEHLQEQTIDLSQLTEKLPPTESGPVDSMELVKSHSTEIELRFNTADSGGQGFQTSAIDDGNGIKFTYYGTKPDAYTFSVNGETMIVPADSNGNLELHFDSNDMIKFQNGTEMSTKDFSNLIINKDHYTNYLNTIDVKNGDIATEVHAGGRDVFNVDYIRAATVTEHDGQTTVTSFATIQGDSQLPQEFTPSAPKTPEGSIDPGQNPNEFVISGQNFEYPADAQIDPTTGSFVINNNGELFVIEPAELRALAEAHLAPNNDFIFRFDSDASAWDLVNTKQNITYVENISLEGDKLHFTPTTFATIEDGHLVLKDIQEMVIPIPGKDGSSIPVYIPGVGVIPIPGDWTGFPDLGPALRLIAPFVVAGGLATAAILLARALVRSRGQGGAQARANTSAPIPPAAGAEAVLQTPAVPTTPPLPTYQSAANDAARQNLRDMTRGLMGGREITQIGSRLLDSVITTFPDPRVRETYARVLATQMATGQPDTAIFRGSSYSIVNAGTPAELGLTAEYPTVDPNTPLVFIQSRIPPPPGEPAPGIEAWPLQGFLTEIQPRLRRGTLPALFAQVPTTADPNSTYFVADTPEEFDVEAQEGGRARYIPRRQVPILVQNPNNTGQVFAHPLSSPFAYDNPEAAIDADGNLNPELLYLLTNNSDPSFALAEAATNGDSGLFALANSSADTPEQRAALYRTYGKAILAIYNSPEGRQIFTDFLLAQGNLSPTPDPQTSMDYIYDHDLDRPQNERLLGRNLSDTVELWFGEIFPGIQEALRDPNREISTTIIRELEFASHAINMHRLALDIKAASTARPATPEPGTPPAEVPDDEDSGAGPADPSGPTDPTTPSSPTSPAATVEPLTVEPSTPAVPATPEPTTGGDTTESTTAEPAGEEPDDRRTETADQTIDTTIQPTPYDEPLTEWPSAPTPTETAPVPAPRTEPAPAPEAEALPSVTDLGDALEGDDNPPPGGIS